MKDFLCRTHSTNEDVSYETNNIVTFTVTFVLKVTFTMIFVLKIAFSDFNPLGI